MRLPEGPGLYIWLLDRIIKGDPVAFARRLREGGFRWVAIKIADGVNTNAKVAAQWRDSLVFPVVAALRAEGIDVWGWQYIYGYSPEAEADVAAAQCIKFGLSGFIIDAEAEYHTPTRAQAGKKYMERLRLRLGSGFPIGLATYRYISYHREFPWASFLGVDFWSPQVYWAKSTNAGYQLRKSVQEYLGLKKLAIIPAGAAYHEWGWSPTTAQMEDFVMTAEELKLPGYLWWEAYYPMIERPDWWAKLVELARRWAGEPPKPPHVDPIPIPVAVRVEVTAYALNVRSGPGIGYSIAGPALQRGTRVWVDKVENGWGRILGTGTWISLAYTKTV